MFLSILQLELSSQLVLLQLLLILGHLDGVLHLPQLATCHHEPEPGNLTATPAWYRPGALEVSVLSQAEDQGVRGFMMVAVDEVQGQVDG